MFIRTKEEFYKWAYGKRKVTDQQGAVINPETIEFPIYVEGPFTKSVTIMGNDEIFHVVFPLKVLREIALEVFAAIGKVE